MPAASFSIRTWKAEKAKKSPQRPSPPCAMKTIGPWTAALLFHWKSLARQIRIEGPLAPVTEAEADAYFASRHRISRIGAWASDQSRPLENRAVLEARVAEMEAKFEGGEPPRPPHWSGFRLTPEHMEFWQDMPYRLHDRVIYTPKPEGGWATQRLFP